MNPIINITKDGFLEIEHPTLGPPATRLSADVAAAATTSTVENNDDFATNDIVVFGKVGQELTEAVTLTSTTGSTTLGHTTGPSFAHSARDPVAKSLYNQAEVYTATSETGTYSLLTTVSLNFQKAKTIYDASGQTSTTWFKVRYKDSVTTVYSAYSDVVVYTGWNFQSLHSMTDEILEEFNDPDAKEISRPQVRRKLRAGVRNLIIEAIKHYPDYHRTYTTQTLTSGTATYDYPTRFLAFFRVDINFSSSTASQAYKVLTFESEAKGYPDTTYLKTDPRVYLRDTTWGIRPTPDNSSGTAFIWYWYYPEEMTEENDTHGLGFGAREPLILYALWRLWMSKDSEKAAEYKADFLLARTEWLNFIAQARQTVTQKGVEVTFGNDMYSDEPATKDVYG